MPNTNVNIYTPDTPTLAQFRFALRNHYHLLVLPTALSALLTFLQSLHLIYQISNAFMYACFSLGDITENDNFRGKFSLVNPGKDQPSCKEETGLYGGEKKVSAVSLVLRVGVLGFFFLAKKRGREGNLLLRMLVMTWLTIPGLSVYSKTAPNWQRQL